MKSSGGTKSSGGEYAHITVADDSLETPIIDAVAITIPSTEYVEVRAPVALSSGYELTVDVDGGHWTVLVVSRDCT